jgi:hypothetical protein
MPFMYELQLDPAETVRASRAVARRTPWGRYAQMVWLAVLVVLVTAALVLEVPIGIVGTWFAVLMFISLATLALPALQRRQIRRAYAGTPSLQGPQSYRFTDEGIEMANALARSNVRWDALVEAAETPDFFLFYYSKKCAYYLPKRVVGDLAAQALLREFVREHLGARAGGLGPVGDITHPS